MNQAPPPTQALAEWASASTWARLGPGVRAATTRSWLNWLGCALGGSSDPAVGRLLAALEPLGPGRVPILGRAEQTDPGTAALVHGFASNILDYDDAHWATAIHPSGPVASAVMAWAGHEQVSGEAALHALALGMEVACRIGLAVSPGHYARGWHITATCGVFGAAVAVGSLMRLCPQKMAWAIGHAATQSAGLVASLGTMAKSLNIGHAARGGLVAARYAQHGITAHEHALEADFGFAAVMGAGARLPADLLERLGEHWEVERNTFKPYPCGFLLHPALDACLGAPDPAINPGAVQRVQVTVHPLARLRADRPQPRDGLEAKLSLQHAVAVALLHRQAGVGAFTDQAAREPALAALRAKVEVADDDTMPKEGARVELHLEDGAVRVRERQPVPGEASPAMSDAALERKFRDLVAHGAPHCDAGQLLAAAADFPSATDAAALIRLCRPGSGMPFIFPPT